MSFALTFTTSLALSLLSKFLVDVFLTERVALIGSFAGLQYSLNDGIAFGINLGPVIQEIVILIALCLVAFIAWKSEKTHFSSVGFGLIVGGAVGNVIDRIPDGHVTDFFQVGAFPIFNVADSCITVGAAVLLLEMAILGKKNRHRLKAER